MKVLVIRFSSIGDIVLTTPVVRGLKTELDAEVHYATKAAYAHILENNPYVDKVHSLGEDFGSFSAVLKQERFDQVVDLHNSLRSRRLRVGLRRPASTFRKLNARKWLFTNFKLNTLPNVHVVDRYMDTVKSLGVKGDTLGLDYFIPEKDEVERGWLPVSHQEDFAAVVLGAKFATKRLPTKRLIELCDRIPKPVVLLGGPAEEGIGQEIERFFQRHGSSEEQEKSLKELGKKTVVFNAVGKLNLNQSASVLKQARWIFTHDTGLMHIGAALNKHLYTIWGNTVPAFGMYPYRTKFTVFENNKLNCRPCSKIGHDKCPKGHFKCMMDLQFDFWLG